MDMKLNIVNSQQFTNYTEDSVTIGGVTYKESILVNEKEVSPSSIKSLKDLKIEDLDEIIQAKPDLILLGSKYSIVYPPVSILKALQDKAIGIEVMTNQALCRTFNFLVGENRKVVALLVF